MSIDLQRNIYNFVKRFGRKKENCYEYIISLGYNCEPAFRFVKYFKCEESNLFNWAYSLSSIDTLMFVLKNTDKIGSEDYSFVDELWECNYTHMKFHGRNSDANYSDDIMNCYKNELSQKIEYLKNKFINYAQNDKKKLYVYKISSKDIESGINLKEKVEELKNTLISIGTNNFKLLIIYEKKYAEYFNFEIENVILRSVKYFAPDENVIGKKFMKNGWDDIYNEFYQSRKTLKQKRRKKYKFDKEFQNKIRFNKYDLVFSLGAACSCSMTLRKSCLQFYSYPLDWVFGANIESRVGLVANGFKDYINKDDLIDCQCDNGIMKNPCQIYKNIKNGIRFNHDFIKGKTLDETYDTVRAKYERRAKRLTKNIESSKRVLAVFIQSPENNQIVDDKELINAHKILQERFKNQEIDLLYLFNKRKQDKILQFRLSENITKFIFDYDGYSEELPSIVNSRKLRKLFCKVKITNKFVTLKNKLARIKFLTQSFLRGWFFK